MCAGIGDHFLDTMASFLTKLSVLDLSMTGITSIGCSYLARMPALREVDISGCDKLSGDAIKALVEGRIGDGSDTDEKMYNDQNTMEHLGLIKEDGSASQLTFIAARFAEGVDANVLETVARKAPNLKVLDLRHHRGHDAKAEYKSPLKLSLRKLRQRGVKVAF